MPRSVAVFAKNASIAVKRLDLSVDNYFIGENFDNFVLCFKRYVDGKIACASVCRKEIKFDIARKNSRRGIFNLDFTF